MTGISCPWETSSGYYRVLTVVFYGTYLQSVMVLTCILYHFP